MSTWKACERTIAKILGGERVPVSGRQRGDSPDIAHDWLSIEVKHRKSLPSWLWDAMDQAQASKVEDQLPIVVLHEKSQKYSECFVLMRLDDFTDYFGE